MLKSIAKRLRAFWDPSAWFLIVLGLFIFSLRIPLPADGLINLPMAFTVFQTAGLMFALYGMQLMASMAVWPDLSFRELLKGVADGNSAAGRLLLGLLIFNGLGTIGLCYWITSALGMASARG